MAASYLHSQENARELCAVPSKNALNGPPQCLGPLGVGNNLNRVQRGYAARDDDHAYPEATVCFTGGPEAGWRVVGLCLAYGFPILCRRRVWYVRDANEPTGPRSEITFREKVH
jgi:hypothetical protein